MFRQKHTVLLVMVAVLTIGLAACEVSADDPPPSVSPSADVSSTVSEKEALMIVNTAYANYVMVSDGIYSEGGSNAARIGEVARGIAVADFKRDASELELRQFRTVGSTTFDSVRIQGVNALASGATSITAYLCSDVSEVDVVDSNGASQVSPDRIARTPYQVVFEVESSTSFVASRNVWLGENFC